MSACRACPLLVALLAAARAALADEPQDTDADDLPSFEVTVTASRAERRVSESAVATAVIDRRQIRQSGATDLSRLLETQPGVQIERTFRGASIRLQGLDPEHVLLLVDGERTAGRIGGSVDFSRFRLEELERVEIVKGASSALYGSDAMGGVVNLVPRRCTRPEYEARLLGTSLLQGDVGASAALPLDDVCFRLSANFRYAPQHTTRELAPESSVDGLLAGGASGRIEWEPLPHLRVLFAVNAARQNSDGVDVGSTGAVFDRVMRGDSLDVTLRPELDLGGAGRLRLSLRQSLFQHQYLQDQRGSNQLDQFQRTLAQVWNLTVQHDVRLGASHQLVAGAEGFWESLTSPNLGEGRGDRGRAALFAQDEWRIGTERPLTLVPGLRLDADTQFGARLSPRLATRFDPFESFSIHGGVGLGFRAATFEEMLLSFENKGVGYVVQGNPALRPERSFNAQLGLEWRPVDQVAATLDLFHNNVDDLITVQTLPRTDVGGLMRMSYVNVARAMTRGGELGVRLRPVRGLRVDLAYALNDTRDLDADRPLEGRPMHRATVTAGYEHRPLGLEASVRAALTGPRPFYDDLDGDEIEETLLQPTYATVDVRVSKTLFRDFSLVVGADNLLDAHDPSYLPLMPRHFYAGLIARH